MINSGYNNANINVSIANDSSNLTVIYTGYRYYSTSEYTKWKMTFYNVPYQKISIEILQNNVAPNNRGTSAICTSSNCYQGIDTTTLQFTTYSNCNDYSGCVYAGSGSCLYTSIRYCGICDYNGSNLQCFSCLGGYVFMHGTKDCVSCSGSSQRVVNGICYPITDFNCATYSHPDPMLCISCKSQYFLNYTNSKCTLCNSDS